MDEYRCMKCGRPMKGFEHECEPLSSHAVLAEVREIIKKMSDDERLDFFSEIQEGYCRHCGCNNPRCQCWNDD